MENTLGQRQIQAADLFSITGSDCFVDFNGIGATADKGGLIILEKDEDVELNDIQLQMGSNEVMGFEQGGLGAVDMKEMVFDDQ